MHHEPSEVLARRLRHNWLLHGNEFKAARGGLDGDCEDDGSLTNLSWLQVSCQSDGVLNRPLQGSLLQHLYFFINNLE